LVTDIKRQPSDHACAGPGETLGPPVKEMAGSARPTLSLIIGLGNQNKSLANENFSVGANLGFAQEKGANIKFAPTGRRDSRGGGLKNYL